MCLALYFATRSEQPIEASPYLSVEALRPDEAWVRQCFTLPIVRYLGTHRGCSCGFRHVICSEPMGFDEPLLYDADGDTLQCNEALLARVQAFVSTDGQVEIFPQLDLPWLSDEPAPLGVIDTCFDGLEPRRLFFVAQFMYRVRRASADQPAGGISSIEK